MYGVFIDGEAGVGKSTVAAALAEDLARDYRIETFYPGDFLRRMTRRVLDEVGLGEAAMPPLDSVVKQVVDSRIAYEDGYDWGNLHDPLVDIWVSSVAAVPEAQYELNAWMRDTTARMQARQTDVLIMDGRNPRERLQKAGAYMPTAVELLLTCNPTVSARRLLEARGEPTDDTRRVRLARNEILNRRITDRTRKDYPYHDPERVVHFRRWHRRRPHGLITRSYAMPVANRPCAIELDTTHRTKERMNDDAKIVGRAGFDLLQS